jgi:RNA polymerase sigma-70 factor (ECF subfamily)
MMAAVPEGERMDQRSIGLEAEVGAERARLVRLCARATGDPDAAEDLAQETLFEAWRAAHKLRPGATADERGRWLSAIARHVCLRWARRRGRELSRRVFSSSPARVDVDPQSARDALDQVPDDFDLDLELERGELVTLLDRAMGLLPPETRLVLYEQIVAESPLAETALRLGVSKGAVAMRLQRGKLALRRVLTSDLQHEALALGLFAPEDVGWQQTRLWCTYCGRHQLEGRFSAGHDQLWLRCPACGSYSHSNRSARTSMNWDDVRGFRATQARIIAWNARSHLPGLERRRVVCAGCGREAPLRVDPVQRRVGLPDRRFQLTSRCPACGSLAEEGHDWLMLCLPEARQFLKAHPRIRFAGTCSVNAEGHEAFVTTYESVTDAARFEVISDAQTLRILSIHSAPESIPKGMST